MRTIFLVRHAHTAWSDAGRYLGRTDVDLDTAGISQAEQLGAWAAAADLDAIVTSPATRAARTAAAVAARTGMSPRHDDRLRELDFGVAEGRTIGELKAAHPEAVRGFETDPVAHAFPGGEDPIAAVARVRAGIADLLAAGSARALVITHSTVLRLFLSDALGLPTSEYRRRFPLAEHCALTELGVPDGAGALTALGALDVAFALRRFNSTLPVNSSGGPVREPSAPE